MNLHCFADDKDGEVIRLTKDGRRIKDGKISKEVFDIEKHQQKKKKKKREKEMMEKSYEEEYVEEFVDEEGNVVKVVKKVGLYSEAHQSWVFKHG